MNNNMIQNPETEVPKTPAMNNRDYLFDILQSTKTLSNNLSTILSEASNKDLFNELNKMFKDVKDAQRDTFNLLFKNGWYPLEKAEKQKISQKITEFTSKMNELNK